MLKNGLSRPSPQRQIDWVEKEIYNRGKFGHSSFNVLQNFGSSSVPLFYYVFDLLVWKSRELRSEHWK
jgi:hypothetical protein